MGVSYCSVFLAKLENFGFFVPVESVELAWDCLVSGHGGTVFWSSTLTRFLIQLGCTPRFDFRSHVYGCARPSEVDASAMFPHGPLK